MVDMGNGVVVDMGDLGCGGHGDCSGELGLHYAHNGVNCANCGHAPDTDCELS